MSPARVMALSMKVKIQEEAQTTTTMQPTRTGVEGATISSRLEVRNWCDPGKRSTMLWMTKL
jgi:hypothetical protein